MDKFEFLKLLLGIYIINFFILSIPATKDGYKKILV